jgi:hypothetical protein
MDLGQASRSTAAAVSLAKRFELFFANERFDGYAAKLMAPDARQRSTGGRGTDQPMTLDNGRHLPLLVGTLNTAQNSCRVCSYEAAQGRHAARPKAFAISREEYDRFLERAARFFEMTEVPMTIETPADGDASTAGAPAVAPVARARPSSGGRWLLVAVVVALLVAAAIAAAALLM